MLAAVVLVKAEKGDVKGMVVHSLLRVAKS